MIKKYVRWVICLGAGASQLPLIKAASDLGYRVLAVDRNPDSEGFVFAAEALVHSIYDADGLITEIGSRSFEGILCRCTGQALFTAAKISDYFGLSGVNYELANISTSKSALREFCTDKHINMPRGIKSNIKNGVISINDFSNYVVVKPDFTLVGKKSIKKISTDDNGLLSKSIEIASIDSGNGLVEIEQFIDGYDCSFLFWMESGTLTLLLDWDELSYFDNNGDLISIGASTPSVAASLRNLDEIFEITNELCADFSSVSALLAFSFRVDKNGKCWLIEIHADYTGDLILDVLAPNASGYNYLEDLTSLILRGTLTDEKFKIMLNQERTPTAVIYDDFSGHEIVKAESIEALHVKINQSINSRAQ